jgi:3-phosphoshikimate 1-carboxyvinyltransferase
MIELHVPGDNSLTHRALLLAALASGRSRVRRALISADTESTARVLRALGCDVPPLADSAELVIEGAGLHGRRAAAGLLDCGNSGTTARLLMGVLAGCAFEATLTGDDSLRARPMRRVTAPLAAMGARFEELEQPDRLPIRMHGGPLRGVHWESPHASAQVKSAILLAGLTGHSAVSVMEPWRSRDHTERMLEQLGVRLTRALAEDGVVTRLEPVDSLPALDFTVPGDFSSAAFVIALACLGERTSIRVRGTGLNPTRTGLLGVLQRMHADVVIENVHERCGEPAGDVVAAPSSLKATRIEPAEIPSLIDEIPVIAVLAARAEGTTTIEGAAELRVKETDRIAALAGNLRALGVHVEEREDGLAVRGTDRPLAGRVRAFGDHRIAMAFGVLAAAGGGGIEIDDPGVVGVSYPGFWNTLEHVSAA